MQIETDRLILRKWTSEDAESLYELCKDPRVGSTCGFPPHTSVENSRTIIDKALGVNDGVFCVTLKDGTIIGSCGVELAKHIDGQDPSDRELGYWIGVPYWGNGYATELSKALLDYAFTYYECNRIWCSYFDGNKRSSRVQEKLGFIYDRDRIIYWSRLDKNILLHISHIDKCNWHK